MTDNEAARGSRVGLPDTDRGLLELRDICQNAEQMRALCVR